MVCKSLRSESFWMYLRQQPSTSRLTVSFKSTPSHRSKSSRSLLVSSAITSKWPNAISPSSLTSSNQTRLRLWFAWSTQTSVKHTTRVSVAKGASIDHKLLSSPIKSRHSEALREAPATKSHAKSPRSAATVRLGTMLSLNSSWARWFNLRQRLTWVKARCKYQSWPSIPSN